MRPAAARFTDTTTEHQHVDDAAIVHIEVIPVVHTCTDDNHRFTMGFMRVFSELTRHLNNALTAYACDDLLPSRRTWYRRVIIIIISDMSAAITIAVINA